MLAYDALYVTPCDVFGWLGPCEQQCGHSRSNNMKVGLWALRWWIGFVA